MMKTISHTMHNINVILNYEYFLKDLFSCVICVTIIVDNVSILPIIYLRRSEII